MGLTGHIQFLFDIQSIRDGLREYMPSEPHGEGDIAVELWKKLEPGEK